MSPSLTLILPAWNVSNSLRRDIENLLEILPDLAARFEVLVLDPGPAHQAAEIARDLSREFPQVRFLPQTTAKSGEARLAAARSQATGDVVLVLEGPPSGQELLRRWRETSSEAASPSVVKSTEALNNRLLARLAKWGEHLRSLGKPANTAPRPASFSTHLRELVDQ